MAVIALFASTSPIGMARADDASHCQDCGLIRAELQTRQNDATSLSTLMDRNRQYHEALPSRQRSALMKLESNMKLIQERQAEVKSLVDSLVQAQEKKGCSKCP